ncbi:hypothetical protein LWI29_035643 [Acer saccharum]|uniref:Uncharacterized protein n=1 Tax=Acer saccharum TaxID=4024 RepID=A0AA39VEP6_ACESA|nr:hypothetical protein LWI29_035643 [Acer saccharum]
MRNYGKESGKSLVNKEPRKQVVPKKDGVKNLRGSRFTILSEDKEGESGGQAKATPSIVLAEISNIRAFRKSQSSCPSSSKFLPVNVPDQVYFNKPFKENVEQKWVKGSNKPNTKGKQQSLCSQPNDMEEDIEDSEVLQLLHKEVMESVDADNISLPVKADCISNLNGEAENSLVTVDVAGNNNFDMVALKLREAMEVATE